MPAYANATALVGFLFEPRMDPAHAAPVLEAANPPGAVDCATLWQQLQQAVQLR
jgi:hypothetical protein